MSIPVSLAHHDVDRSYVIRGAKLLDANHWRGENADILIIGDSIAAIAPRVEAPESSLVLAAEGLLIHPGFVNAHTHGHSALAKGTGDRWTLELFLAAGPWTSGRRSPEDRYLSAAL